METIFALATAPLPAGVAVVRLSGPRSVEALRALSGRDQPPERQMSLRELSWAGVTGDKGLVVWFSEGKSFTGEEVVELHLHGGRATIEWVMDALSEFGLRLAEPGEFTRRALKNGRLDLVQVEALADLIDAETEAQRLQAATALDGAVSDEIATWRDSLIECLALIEASIDFADEDDAPVDVTSDVDTRLSDLVGSFEAARIDAEFGERVREGFSVALVGAPNVGKSSLINCLAKREVSLVSPYAGTTRDVIEAHVSIDGLPVTFFDLAGLREADDPIEAMGVERAVRKADGADLRIFLSSIDTEAPVAQVGWRDGDLRVELKADLGASDNDIAVSAKTGEGVDWLWSKIGSRLQGRRSGFSNLSRRRHRESIDRAIDHAVAARTSPDVEIAAFEIREAARQLDLLVGRISTEDVLDEVFSRFCMGK